MAAITAAVGIYFSMMPERTKSREANRDTAEVYALLSFSVPAIIYMNRGSEDNAATWPGTMPLPSSCVLSSAPSPPEVPSLRMQSKCRRRKPFSP